MKNGLIFFLGLFAAIGISWAGIVVGSEVQLGGLAPYYDDSQGQSFPLPLPGQAAQGQLVYRDLNCAACHTQQVRRPDFGSDQARGWGDRQSVARDYIYQPFVQLGESRRGPDLANLAGRKPPYDEADLLNLLYAGKGTMPAYRFLFTEEKIVGQTSEDALQLVGHLAPPAGTEVVPTSRAKALAAYLLSLNMAYDYPEARPYVAPKEGAAK
jgi:cytochrome c oxidase cbb3-type subunit 2